MSNDGRPPPLTTTMTGTPVHSLPPALSFLGPYQHAACGPRASMTRFRLLRVWMRVIAWLAQTGLSAQPSTGGLVPPPTPGGGGGQQNRQLSLLAAKEEN